MGSEFLAGENVAGGCFLSAFFRENLKLSEGAPA
jgi:hypothetical protein